MNFTDIFIRRPVLATVVSLVILVVGALFRFATGARLSEDRKRPVTMRTAYPGADPDSVAGFITTPIERPSRRRTASTT